MLLVQVKPELGSARGLISPIKCSMTDPVAPLRALLLLLFSVTCFSSDLDVQCLRDVHNSVVDPNGILKSTWNFDNNTNGFICRFTGVECWHPDENRVLSLHLGNLGLQGLFPRGLPNCTSMTGLDLSYNNFTGIIPQDISVQVSFLTSLDLSNNGFSGQIPVTISQMSYLNTLDLQGNQLSGEIPGQFSLLTPLRSFNVADNRLSGRIPPALSKYPAQNFAGNQGLCGIPLDACPVSKSKSSTGLIGAVVGVVAVIVMGVIVVLYCLRKLKDVEEGNEEFGELPGKPMRFTFQQLKEATGQFQEKLGEGGFGSVFQGKHGEERIAVKRLDDLVREQENFWLRFQQLGAFIISIWWIYHRHDNDTPPLDWQTRQRIITHIAKGLSYLHEECMKRIAHLDVKPQNILLDENFNAKLSDFGLCKLIDRDKSQVVTRMRGTPGYLAPEWLTSQITEKADVYSFGVVVMEIISGRKNLDTSQSEESIHLVTLLEEKVKSDQLVDLIDKPSSDLQAHKHEVIQMMKLAMWCLQIDCKRRPQMSEVVKVLEGNMDIETNIDHNFVATSQTMFGVAENIGSSGLPLASDLSGPR
ncbi:hypothetical protein ACP4OV_021887 [Aristida adscensionis]